MSQQTDVDDLVALFARELELCKVRDQETVAVLSQGNELGDYAQGFVRAVGELGAKPVEVKLPGKEAKNANERLAEFGVSPLSNDPKTMGTLKSADMVIDLMVASFSKEEEEITNAGARMLLVAESADNLKRLFPTPEQRERSEAGGRRLGEAKTFRFTNAAGTDVTYEFGSFRTIVEYGYTDEPGRWDHWGGSLVATCARESAVNGRVVMAPGDMLLPQLKLLTEPIEFVIRDGRIVEVNGEKEAEALLELMKSYLDPRAFAVSHIGWGTNEKAVWRADGIGMNGRSYYGNVLFSLGPNTEFGGDNDTACHLDLPMRNCTAYLDGEMIIDNGRIMSPELRPADA